MLNLILNNLKTLDSTAIQVLGANINISYKQLYQSVNNVISILDNIKRELNKQKLVVGIFLSNSPEWIAVDLSLLLSGDLEIPVPTEFSKEQCQNLLQNVDICFVERKNIANECLDFLEESKKIIIDINVIIQQSKNNNCQVKRYEQKEIIKAIHTSGTTSMPKGVLISYGALSSQVSVLKSIIGFSKLNRYLSLVPMSLLIEQIFAIYLTISTGGCIFLLPPDYPAFSGTTNASDYLPYIRQAKPSYIVLPPALLDALLSKIEGLCNIGNLEEVYLNVFGTIIVPFIACGGAPVSLKSLNKLLEYGIMIYEGYGLSEMCSVVAMNTPRHFKLGSVGKLLPGVFAKINEKNEFLVKSNNMFNGYIGTDPSSCYVDQDGFLNTGDIANIDEEGFIHIIGRSKNMIILNSGRNISPEWIETKLSEITIIKHAFIFGDGMDYVTTFIFTNDLTKEEEIYQRICEINSKLPEYAAIKKYEVLSINDTRLTECFTVTKRPKRELIIEKFNFEYNKLYSS